MSSDKPSAAQKKQAKQYLFWTAVVVVVGYVVFFII